MLINEAVQIINNKIYRVGQKFRINAITLKAST